MPPSDTAERPDTARVDMPAPRPNEDQTWEYADAVGLPRVGTYTAEEFARMLGIPKDQIMKAMRSGDLRRHPWFSSPWRATAEEFGRWLRVYAEVEQ